MAEPVLSYDDAADDRFVNDVTVELGATEQHLVALQVATAASSSGRANEDAIAAATHEGLLYLAAFDGAGGIRTSTAAEVTAGRFASHVVRDAFTDAVRLLEPSNVIFELNRTLTEANKQFPGVDGSDPLTLPGTGATVAQIDWESRVLSVGHVGHGYCMVWYEDGASELITSDVDNEFDEAMFEYVEGVAQQQGISNREAFALPAVREKITEATERKSNRSDGRGAGIVNGLTDAQLYIEEVNVDLAGVRSVLVATDGFTVVQGDPADSEYRYWLGRALRQGGVEHVLNHKFESEEKDPDWEHVRYAHSDDASALYLRL